MRNLAGVHPPLTTPFADGRPSPTALSGNIVRLQRQGVAGYLLLGSTGEAAYLEESEKLALLETAREAVPSDRTLMVGVGLESTGATCRLARLAGERGADVLLVLTPFYFRARMSDEALLRHFAAVADASPVPVLLYNVPMFTGITIPPPVVERLAAHGNVAGLKDSAGDLAWLVEILGRVPAEFQVLCGSAFAFQPALAAGAVGGILAVANAVPEPYLAIHGAQVRGDSTAALALQKRVQRFADVVGRRYGLAGVKAAMDARGLAGGDPRAPLLPLPADDRGAVASTIDEMVAAGLLPARELA